MINIAYFSFDDIRYPCPVIRVFAPAWVLQSRVRLLSAVTRSGNEYHEDPAALAAADIVLVQRAFPHPNTATVCEAILSSGKPVIYETDDALQYVPVRYNDPIFADGVAPAIEEFVKHADLVTVPTAPLAALFARLARRVVVLPNYLSPDLWTEDLDSLKPSGSNRVRIGFVGSRYHDRDFATLVPLLRETLTRYANVEIVSYGGITGGLENDPRFSVIPGDYDYAQYPRRLAAVGMGIALAPLTGSRLNRCRSNIKFLEFGFLGIPGIFADLEPYRGTVLHGKTGFLCDERLSSWREALFTLIESAELRKRIGDAARQEVRGSWMLNDHKEEWLRAYDMASKSRSRRGRR